MADTTKRPARKTAAKTTAKKTSAKKAPTKKTTSKRTAARKSDAPSAEKSQRQQRSSGEGRSESGQGPSKSGASRAALSGAQQLADLTGKEFEGIVGIKKSDDGWTVQVEVLEMRRIPATTDVLALYEVEVDTSGDLTGYRRAGRYVRGKPGEEG